MFNLTSEDIQDLGQVLGYSLGLKGVCAGLSGMWIQAALLEEEHLCANRLHLIEKYSPRPGRLFNKFDTLKEKIDKVRKNVIAGQSLNEEERELLEIPAFYEGLRLYLLPFYHPDLFNGSVNQNDFQTIYSLIKPAKLENKDLFTLLKKNYAFDKAGLKTWLNELSVLLKESSTPIPIRISSDSHTVYLKYDALNGCWHYLDTLTSIVYYDNLDTNALIEKLFESFEDTEVTLFEIALISNHCTPNLKEKFHNFDIKYPIKPAHSSMYNERQVGLLWLAAENGDKDAVVELLKNKAEVNHANNEQQTPLFIACQNGHPSVVNELLINKAKVDHPDSQGRTPLHMACFRGNLEIVNNLITNGADIHKSDDLEETTLYIACLANHLDIVKELLKNKVDSNKGTIEGNTPLLMACSRGNKMMVAELLKNGADINKENHKGITPLFSALLHSEVDVVKELLRSGASMTYKNSKGKTLLNMDPNPKVKPILLRTYFNVLLLELLDKKNELDSQALKAAEKLHTKLTAASELFFNSFKTQEDYKQFNNSCDTAIIEARDVLNNHHGWNNFFAMLLLGIISLGIIPLVLAVNSKVTTGSWQFSLFKPESSKKLDEIQGIITEIDPDKKIAINFKG